MKTAKEFFERLQSDEAFAKEASAAISAKREAGAASYCDTIIPVAAEYGYEISKEELDAIYEAQTAEMSEEELGKVAGGGSCLVVVTIISLISTFATLTVSLNETSVELPDTGDY